MENEPHYEPQAGNELYFGEFSDSLGTNPAEKKQVQKNLVGTCDDRNEYLIGSCKFRNGAIGVDELELPKNASTFGKYDISLLYFFKRWLYGKKLKASTGRGEVKLICLEDMYL